MEKTTQIMVFFICLLGALQSQGLDNDRESQSIGSKSIISSTGNLALECDEGLSFDGSSISTNGNLTLRSDKDICFKGPLSSSGRVLIETDGKIAIHGTLNAAEILVRANVMELGESK